MKLWHEIKEKMLCFPTQKVCEEGAEMSYEDLTVYAEVLAEQMRGIRCCAVLCRSEMAAAISLLACFAAGVTAVPLSWRYGEIHCQKILARIGPDALMTDEEGRLHIRRLPGAAFRAPSPRPALIMCTSGTTGTPKGAQLSEDNILCNVADIADYFAIGKTDAILIVRPLYHCATLTGEFLLSLTKGCRIRFYSEKFNPPQLLQLIDKYRISVLCGTPTLLGMLARFNRGQATTLRHLCVSGECMSPAVGRQIAAAFPLAEIYHVYGLTEAGPRVAWLPPRYFADFPDCVGLPLRSVSLRIRKENGQPAARGEQGMLYVKGKNVMTGYYDDPGMTRKVLCDGWLKTGDIAEITPEGFLKIKGRKDDLIIKAGMNIYPQEIEAALRRDARVREVMAYGYKTPGGQTQIGLQIAGAFSSVDEVRQLCGKLLPAYQVPLTVELLPELAKNGSGKIRRRRAG